MINAINIALGGMDAATRKLASSASNIVKTNESGVPEGDFATEAVNMKVAKNLYKANAAVISTASEMSDDLMRVFDKKV
jgi:flagellar basal body rod protein FlgC